MMEPEGRERWALSADDVGCLYELTGTDELMATWSETDEDGHLVGDAWQVVVLRNGTVTDRNWDGTIGVPQEIRDLIGGEDTLYHPMASASGFEETARWVDVVVSPDGAFLRLAGEPRPHGPGI